MSELERTKRIAERLPEFYRTWDPDSVIFKVLDSVGRALAEEQKSVFRVMRTHWVDTANGRDLDRLAAIFELRRDRGEADDDYRARIKSALRQFKGGGTGASIRALMADYLSADPRRLEISENPERALSVEMRMAGGDTWTLGSMSVEDASPVIEMVLQGEGDVVLDPALVNLDTGQRVGFRGRLRAGQRLVMRDGSATLDGEDVSQMVTASPSFPKLTPGGSRWVYEEAITAKIVRLGRSAFDASIFSVPVPDAVVRFTWSGRQPSTFSLKVPANALEESGVSEEEAADFLNVIKGAGVMARLVVE
ncbi:MAG TPA: hypothetical protein VLX56_09630 [Nitrososphaerales archaeon]|nr:hypothetical protein [Nitrososphaerales archaeon]